MTEPTPQGPIHLIVNERAGRGKGALAGARAHEVLVARGARVHVAPTRGPGDAAVLAHQAREAGAAVVAAVGGDGTLHEVANGLLAPEHLDGKALPSPIPALGSIPVGSGNDYVKMLGIPRNDPAAAAALLLDGEARAVDVGVIEGAAPREGAARSEIFLNNVGLAFAGDANAWIESTRGLPGYLAYFAGSVIAFFAYKHYEIDFEIDGRRQVGKPTIIHVNIGKYCGGGVVFTPEAELDDGFFDVLVLGYLSKVGAAIAWKGVTTGQGKNMRDVSLVRAKEVIVRAPEGKLLHVDGEVRRFVGQPVRFRILPKALRVLGAPRPVTATSGPAATAPALPRVSAPAES